MTVPRSGLLGLLLRESPIEISDQAPAQLWGHTPALKVRGQPLEQRRLATSVTAAGIQHGHHGHDDQEQAEGDEQNTCEAFQRARL